jgi:DNA-binding MarR family transcriptional regulator
MKPSKARGMGLSISPSGVVAAELPLVLGKLPVQKKAAPKVEEPHPAITLESVAPLDPLIHERTRLAILTALATTPEHSLSFLTLRESLQLTDGNLQTHLRALEQGGLLERSKTGAGRGSATTVHLTEKGQQSFTEYLNVLEDLIKTARGQKEDHV